MRLPANPRVPLKVPDRRHQSLDPGVLRGPFESRGPSDLIARAIAVRGDVGPLRYGFRWLNL